MVRCILFVVTASLALAGCGSRDPTLTLVDLGVPAAAGSMAPRVVADRDGAVLTSWLEPDGKGHALRYARYRDGRWSAPRTAARGDDWFVNWADTPGVFAHGELLVAHWLRKSGASAYAYDVMLSVSRDDGASWSPALSPHHDGVAAEHGFLSWFPQGEGFGLVWLDGRNSPGGMEAAGHDGHAEHGAMMTIRYGLFDAAGTQTFEGVIDESTCDCCPTDVAATAAGPVLVYRDRMAGELRDVFASRLSAGAWTAPQPVHVDSWKMPGCPVNGPAVDADAARVAVAWFTAAGDVPKVLLAWSVDSGAQFAAPLRIDGGHPVGRVEVVVEDDVATVLWLEQLGTAGAELRARRAWAEGALGKPQVLATTAAARASGFPRAVRSGAATYLTWTEVAADNARQVRVGALR